MFKTVTDRWMRHRVATLAAVAGVSLLAACGGAPKGEDQAATSKDQGTHFTPEQVSELVLSSMDLSADPCQDFYRYACGGWLDHTERPADQPRWVRSTSVIRVQNQEVLRDIAEEAAANPGDDPDRIKVGRFYGSCMDEAAIAAAGSAPLKPLLAEIEKVQDVPSLFTAVGHLHPLDVNALFAIGPLPDFKNPQQMIAFIGQGGLGLPERGYYLREDEQSRQLLDAYRQHVARMLGLVGEEAATAETDAGHIVALETELARFSRSPAELRDVEKMYNKVDISGLKALTPSLPWDAFLEANGYPGMVEISVATPEFFQGLEPLVASTDMAVFRAYLRWQLVRAMAEYMAPEFEQAHFDFYNRTLTGQEQMEPRWQRCIEKTDDALGDALGKLFVERQFAGESKQVALEMIQDVEHSFKDNLNQLAWMDDETRARAVEKADAVGNKIGYPDKWQDYSKLEIQAGDYFANAASSLRFDYHHDLDKVGQPVDPTEWGMTPPTVNAYYSPLRNEMVFPAGIMQPPLFHRDFPAAMNYGATGLVVGHEFSHGFDDSGRKFDAKGQLVEWWSPQVVSQYQERAECVSDLYDTYEVEPGLAINGKLTLGENIADLGGIKQAYRAYRRWVERNGEQPPAVQGLTNDQLFFVSFGQVWCAHQTPEVARMRVRNDPHSDPRFRVVGPLSNFSTFAETFGCAEGTSMRREPACEVW